MPKLHELLAVQDNLKGQATKVMNDLKGTFANKPHLFEESVTTLEPTTEDIQAETVVHKTIQTTVPKEIGWISKHIAKGIDIGYQVDIGNTAARAEVYTEDGAKLLPEMPATALMQLEHRLVDIKEMIQAIKTLDPAKGFTIDTNKGLDVYKAREVRKVKTQKVDKPVTIAPATDKHPAQAVLKTYDLPVGHLLEQEWSGLITPAKKSELLDQVEIAIRAIKSARGKANNLEVDVKELKIGNTLLDFIFEPLNS